MLASRAVSRAAELISGEVAPQCKAGGSPVVVLGRDEAFDLNSAQTMMARMDYHSQILTQAMPQKTGTGGNKWFSLPLALNLISAAAGLFGNDVKVSAIELPEINDAMLANAVAGRLADCAILPSAGGGIADFEHSKVAQKLTALVKLRNEAAQALAGLPAKANAAQKARAQSLKTAIAEFDDFYKSINTPEADGKTALIRAILVERVALAQSPLLLRVAVTRSGGTITNAKNVKTFFGADPVRVSGGLIATYALVNATSGAVVAAGTTACQTAQAKLRNVQSGAWFTYDSNGKPIGRAEAVCH